MPRKAKIPFFSDQNVAESAVEALSNSGHEATRLRDCMAPDSKDPLVALACANSGHVLVTHDRDFRNLSKRLNITQNQYRLSLHRLMLMCDEPLAAERIRQVMPLIESEWKIAKRDGKTLVLEIYNAFIKVYR